MVMQAVYLAMRERARRCPYSIAPMNVLPKEDSPKSIATPIQCSRRNTTIINVVPVYFIP